MSRDTVGAAGCRRDGPKAGKEVGCASERDGALESET